MSMPEQIAITSLDDAAGRLEESLELQREAHETLLSLAARREAAVRAADPRALASCIAEESAVVRRVAELDRTRSDAVAWFTSSFGPPERGEATATWIAERLGDPWSERIRKSANRLREVLVRLSERSAGDRLALESLASHMAGLMRAAHEKLSHAGTYGSRGVVAPGPRVVSSMDLTT